MEPITGECFCGAIEYEINGTLSEALSCHCSRCRKAFSGAGSAVGWIDPEAFHWRQGEELLTTYMNADGMGLGFCKRCGSTLCGFHQGKLAVITLGTLNSDPEVKLARHIFVGSKADWDEIGGTAPQYETWPP